jgi:hypothetical protein
LTNGGFEQGFSFRQGCGHVGLGWGWASGLWLL